MTEANSLVYTTTDGFAHHYSNTSFLFSTYLRFSQVKFSISLLLLLLLLIFSVYLGRASDFKWKMHAIFHRRLQRYFSHLKNGISRQIVSFSRNIHLISWFFLCTLSNIVMTWINASLLLVLYIDFDPSKYYDEIHQVHRTQDVVAQTEWVKDCKTRSETCILLTHWIYMYIYWFFAFHFYSMPTEKKTRFTHIKA